MNQLELVRTYEPILKFSNDGAGNPENFFPFSVDLYVSQCRLYQHGQDDTPIVPPQGLTIESLAQIPPRKSQHCYLSFVADKTITNEATWRQWFENRGLQRGTDVDVPEDEVIDESDFDPAESFGIGTDIKDGVTETQQLPPEVTQAAINTYCNFTDFMQYPPIYYYRVLHNRGYLVIQYWFFYAYNDWGGSHGGMNDHEGDWEVIYLFLEDGKPTYAAYAAHEGMELHAWDSLEHDNETHPVIYVGCGSHGSYTKPAVHVVAGVLKDYAVGDGAITIGPKNGIPWGTPVDIEGQSWTHNYAGRWGSVFKRFGLEHVSIGTRGPLGPAWQFDRWERPVYTAKLSQ